jgi:hypothetical protein
MLCYYRRWKLQILSLFVCLFVCKLNEAKRPLRGSKSRDLELNVDWRAPIHILLFDAFLIGENKLEKDLLIEFRTDLKRVATSCFNMLLLSPAFKVQVSLVIRGTYVSSFWSANLDFEDKKSLFDQKIIILDYFFRSE